ncbi:hypothetical protein [Kitasatospora sp. CB01950]|uniref:hypothetical protein n=1 Tax=Kitasatospora sp. CB01950 TaxID=1703930 RepID=UPI00093F0E7A|nr:hypothetical protein [Kitasatospora sp. CB01950]OKJ13673.1 hypothetical protein AMK19_09515 [Kitasatospora sp. CB01950]
MTTATPPRATPGGLALGFLTGGVIGGSLAAFIGGCIVGKASLVVTGLALPAAYGLLFFLGTLPRRARDRAAVPRTALAMIESREAVAGEATEVPVRFDLTVAPDDGPAYRVAIRQGVHLSELPDYRPRGIVVVEYEPERPWKVRIVTRPTPAWEERAADAHLDSAPGPAMTGDARKGCVGGVLTVLGLLFGAASVLLLSGADPFGPDASGAAPQPSGTVVSSTTTVTSSTTVTSATGTVALGAGRSMLDQGELRTAVESLTQDAENRRALTVVVQERLLTIVFAPAGGQVAGFDPRALPFDRVAALVEDAGTTLGTGSPQSWQLTADGLTGRLTLRVMVTGDRGAGSLEADGQGNVLRRNGS